MLKKSITFIDYNGTERTEDFLFNLTAAELREMDYSAVGGMIVMLKKIIAAHDLPTLMKIFKDLILRSYGEKSADGKRFIKSEELRTAFEQTEAYSILFMELSSDDKAAAAFVNGLVPSDIAAKASASAT